MTRDGVAVVCHDAKFKGFSISRTAASQLQELPTLEAALQRYGTRAFLDIELKVSGIEAQLLRLLSLHPANAGVVISSFLPRVLLELRDLDAAVPLGLICETPRQLRRWRELPIATVIAHQSLVTRRLLNEVHEAGRSLWAWTVNRRSTVTRLAKLGVDGLISDRTDLLGQALR
jgi:glycerophosphoryl diester phosphodiesterase